MWNLLSSAAFFLDTENGTKRQNKKIDIFKLGFHPNLGTPYRLNSLDIYDIYHILALKIMIIILYMVAILLTYTKTRMIMSVHSDSISNTNIYNINKYKLYIFNGGKVWVKIGLIGM